MNLEKIVAGDVSGQLGHGLPAGTAYSEQQGVALGLPQDAADPGDVLDGIQEHDKRHRLLRLCVVVREVLIDGRLRGTSSEQRTRSTKKRPPTRCKPRGGHRDAFRTKLRNLEVSTFLLNL